ncbi:MAG: hypothetical protein HONDAALG_03321 [Gammaproteobacteria bacterium]|nr:hypothetical protein [Gammaproteobacteria bacterium]
MKKNRASCRTSPPPNGISGEGKERGKKFSGEKGERE